MRAETGRPICSLGGVMASRPTILDDFEALTKYSQWSIEAGKSDEEGLPIGECTAVFTAALP